MRYPVWTLFAAVVAGTVLAEPYIIRRSADWIPATPCTMVKAGSALDFSSFGFADGPCGKYGRIVARGENFEYELRPGGALRFMGVNLCETANTLPPEESRQLVENLVRLGYNSVRIHHHERALTVPDGDGIAFNPEALDHFDVLMAACREKGVYVTTDLYVSRRVPWRSIGVDRDGNAEYFRTLIHFHDGAKSNYLAFARNFLNHVNPYTKLRYADDPTLAWISLVNEGNMVNWDIKPYQRYESLVLPKWREWLAARRAKDPAYAVIPEVLPKAVVEIPKDDRVVAFTENLTANGGKLSSKVHIAAFQQFLAHVEADFLREMKLFLRDELGCRALVTDMNGWRFTAYDQLVRNRFDYVDDHFYYAHPAFLGPNWSLPARVSDEYPTNIRKGDEFGVPYNVTRRIFGRPFTVSEYNYCPPWQNRTSCAFLCGATAALQGWSALWRFCWTCDARGAVDSSKKHLNHFDMAGDPCATATERAIFCLFMRRDMPELSARTPILYRPSSLRQPGDLEGDPTDCPSRWMAWNSKIGALVAESSPYQSYAASGMPNGDEIVVRDRSVNVNRRNGAISVDTPRTAGAFLEKPGKVDVPGLKADVHGKSTAVWVSSLDTKPIRESGRLLLTLISDVQNDGIEYEDESMQILRSWGRGGRIARRTTADVSIPLKASSSWKVYALNPDGSRKREVDNSFVEGRLRFHVDTGGNPNEAEFYYELEDGNSRNPEKTVGRWIGELPQRTLPSGAAVPSLDEIGPKSIFVQGDFSRFEKVWTRLERREDICIAVVGGSITEGAGASEPNKSWGEMFCAGWRRAFPDSKIEFVNAGIGATGSDIGAFRLKQDVLDKRPDVVVVEFSVNDGNTRDKAESYEGVVRQLLKAPGDIAVVLLGMVSESGQNAQEWHGKVARHYNLPFVSYRDALYPYVKDGIIKWSDISPDTVHPNDIGHAYAALLLNRLCASKYRAWKAGDRLEVPVAPLPEPLFGTRYDSGEFKRMADVVALDSQGFFPLKDRCWGEGLACTNAGSRLVVEVEGATIALLYRLGCEPYDWGKIDVSIDGRKVASGLDCHRNQWWWYTPSLFLCRDEPGHHIVEVVALHEKNAESSGFGCHLTGLLVSGVKAEE